MKKSYKLLLIVLIVASLVFVLTGCGKKEETTTKTEENVAVEENKTDTGNTETKSDNKTNTSSTSKTYKIVSTLKNNYILSMEQEGSEEAGEVTVAVKDGKMYMDATTEGQRVTIIYKDETTYIISHEEKMYMVSKEKIGDELNQTELISADELKEIETAEFKTGKETIDGQEYDYEEFNKDGTERYYFLGDELKYIKQIGDDGEQTIKINKLSANVDDSLFEIPEGYTKIDQ